MTHTRYAWVGIVAVSALLLVGCDSGSGRAESTPTAGPTTTSAAPTATPSPTAEEVVATETAPAGSDADAQAFLAAYRAGIEALTTQRLHMEIPGVMVVDAQQRLTPGDEAMVMTLQGPQTIELQVANGHIYMSAPDAPGKFYDVTAEPEFAELVQEQDPYQQLDQFEQFMDSVTMVGQEEVDGVAATHYTVALDGKRMGLTADQLASFGPTIDYDFWMDAQGRAVKVQVLGGMTMTMSGFDEPMEIQAPTPDQIVPIPR